MAYLTEQLPYVWPLSPLVSEVLTSVGKACCVRGQKLLFELVNPSFFESRCQQKHMVPTPIHALGCFRWLRETKTDPTLISIKGQS